MAIKLNHTIVHSLDPRGAAEWLTTLFDLPLSEPFGPFFSVKMSNEVTLDYLDAGEMEVQLQHYAFIVTDHEFDRIFEGMKQRGVTGGSRAQARR